MSENLSLSCIEVLPSQTPVGSVIWMHGLGASADDFAPIVPDLNLTDLPLRFIFPNAPQRPVTINNGYVMPAWYDITSLGFGQKIDYEGINNTIKQIHEIIDQEEALGIPTDKIILAGFSQGAVMALATGIHYPQRLGGMMALSGYLPYTADMLTTMTNNQETPIFLAHGTNDMVVPYQAGLMALDTLQRLKFNISWHSYPMGHSVCIPEIMDISKWLHQVFNK